MSATQTVRTCCQSNLPATFDKAYLFAPCVLVGLPVFRMSVRHAAEFACIFQHLSNLVLKSIQ